jgi:hypothetical protein
MTTRNRTHDWVGDTGGTAQRYINGTPITLLTQDNTTFPAYRGNCIDVIGNPGGDNTLVLEKTNRSVKVLTGTHHPSAFETRTYNAWVPGIQRTAPSHLSFSAGNNGADAIAVLARTNPNRAEMNLPVSIFELRDLPRMVQFAGKTITKRSANSYLNWQFGWVPLINDLRKLMDFNARVDRRVREFHSLYNKGGLRRKLTLAVDNKEDHSVINTESNLADLITCQQNRFSTRRRWATVRWLPTSLPPVDESGERALARKLVFDLQLSKSNLWQAMPWSWLIDWFVNIGDFIEANKNTIPVSHSPVCIMEQKVTKVSWVQCNAQDFGFGKDAGTGSAIRQSKTRAVIPGTFLSTTPFLGIRQLSILGALAITKAKPYGWPGF